MSYDFDPNNVKVPRKIDLEAERRKKFMEGEYYRLENEARQREAAGLDGLLQRLVKENKQKGRN